MSTCAQGSGIRLAELLATLSLATDLALGQPMEHVLRSSRIALELGQRLNLDESTRAVSYYVGLLAWAGSHSDSRVPAGKLDAEAVETVLEAADHSVARRREWAAGLTPREVEVLRAVARGLSDRQVADLLSISPKAARNHVEQIYSKIGVSSRAAASLFAMRHGLLSDLETPADEAKAPFEAETARG